MEYLKRLNWLGWAITYFLCILAGFANVNATCMLESLILGLVFGFVFSLFPLFAGMDDKPKQKI